MRSEVTRRMRWRLKQKPWHYRFKIKAKVQLMIWRLDIIHYWKWITSKQYRDSYGECTFWCDSCYKFNWDKTDPYCINNPKCVLKKSGVYYIDF